MEWLQVVILAIVQGVTEFLPISSSAHLILIPVFTDWNDQGLAMDVALHVGTLSAVMTYFYKDIQCVTFAWFSGFRGAKWDADGRLGWWIILGTVPVGLAGILFRDWVALGLRSPLIIAAALMGFGLFLAYADWGRRSGRTERELRLADVLWIGAAQALALIPGTSRSGITMTAALLLGLNRAAAARFSFLLSIPVIILAGGLEVLGLVSEPGAVDWGVLIGGALLAGVSAYLTIHYFLKVITRIGMQPFVIYRVVLGILLLWFFV